MLCSSAATAKPPAVFPVNNVVVNGPPDQRINIVFLSEGYTSAEMDKFAADVQTAIADLFTTSPYQEYESYFNVYAIEVPSRESGTDHPDRADDEEYYDVPRFRAATYFGSTFDYNGIHRLLVCKDMGAINAVLQGSFPAYDIVFVAVNTPYYGGSGGGLATFSQSGSATEVAIHEVGHSFAHLADEYDYCCGPAYEQPNATAETIRELIKWNSWIAPQTPVPTPDESPYLGVIGLFEGAVYNATGWYRPKHNCKMRSLNVPFCEVCAEHTVVRIYELLNTIPAYAPAESNVSVLENKFLGFSVSLMRPEPNTVTVAWYVNGLLASPGTPAFFFNASAYGVGSHEVSVRANDTTALVRNDPDLNLKTEITWNVEVIPVGEVLPTPPITAISDSEREFDLGQNVPNPFNPVTTIRYYLPGERMVLLVVYDLQGRRIRTLASGMQESGEKRVTWDGTNDAGRQVSSGIYFYRLQAGQETSVRKMILMK